MMFVPVDIGSGWNVKELQLFVQEKNYPWSVGLADRKVLEAFAVKVQSTKIAIDADGVIIYRAGYGKGTNKEWISVFEKLSG